MVDWKNIGVPITVALIGGTAAIITGLGGFIIGSLFVPVVNISKDPNSIENKSTIIDITNTGSASAKNLKLTIQAPVYVSFKHPIFSTERYNETKTEDPTRLELYVPRLVEGEGTLISIEGITHPGANLASGDYIVYATYDQGSARKSISIIEKPQPPLTLPEQISNFWIQFGNASAYLTIGITILTFAIGALSRKVRKQQASSG